MSKIRNRPAVELFAGLGIIAAVATYWFGRETVMLARSERPYTWYSRNFLSWHPWKVILGIFGVGVALGAAITHFVGDEGGTG